MDGASGTITQAQDFDAWGDICRSYTTADTTVNKFTGKERDQETGYDYFGARYYDSRISVWLSPDPLFEKHLQWSPYNYVLRNPFVLIDPDGKQIKITNNPNTQGQYLEMIKNSLPEDYRQYIGVTEDENLGSIINTKFLDEAKQANLSYSEEFERFYFIATSSEVTELKFVDENYQIYSKIIDENSGSPIEKAEYINTKSTVEGKELERVGLTLVSGLSNTKDYPPSQTSKNGKNEIYIYNKATKIELQKTFSHEVYVHLYYYLKKMPWRHGDANINDEANQYEERAKTYYKNY